MGFAFLNGWGLAPKEAAESLAKWDREFTVRVVPLNVDCVQELCADKEDTLIAYSTGTLVALHSERLLKHFSSVILLAPIFDFRAESNLGGKVRTAQLQYLLRWLKRDALAAVNDFRKRAGFRIEMLEELPMDVESLVWGIEFLANYSVGAKLPANCKAYVGAIDPLLNTSRIADLVPEVVVVPNAGHSLDELLKGVRGLP